MALYEIAKAEKAEALTICCKLEEEVAQLDPAEKAVHVLVDLGEKGAVGEAGDTLGVLFRDRPDQRARLASWCVGDASRTSPTRRLKARWP